MTQIYYHLHLGDVSDSDAYTSATAITNREFEESEQDKKRKIRLLRPSFCRSVCR